MIPFEATSTLVPATHLTPASYMTNPNGDRASLKTASDGTTPVALSPCVTAVSDTKSFYSAVEGTDSTAMEGTQVGARRRRRTTSSLKSSDKSSRRYSVTRSSALSPSSSQLHQNSISMSPKKREDLLAFHRDSCRLFQSVEDGQLATNDYPNPTRDNQQINPTADQATFSVAVSRSSYTAPAYPASRLSRSASPTAASPAMSPALISHTYTDHDADISDEEVLVRSRDKAASMDGQQERSQLPHHHRHYHSSSPHHHTIPTTVMHWTSSSTRRREYEKIDRNNRGIRRFWRKVAPKCFQTSTSRTPFFEEGKNGKGNYEGSVRRFRMDIPDDEKEEDEPDGQAQEPMMHTAVGDDYDQSRWWQRQPRWDCWS